MRTSLSFQIANHANDPRRLAGAAPCPARSPAPERTAIAALRSGRSFFGELNADYVEIAQKRLERLASARPSPKATAISGIGPISEFVGDVERAGDLTPALPRGKRTELASDDAFEVE